MEEVLQIVAVVAAAALGFTIAGVAGFGGGVVTLPVLVWAFGPLEAVPIIAISQLIATATRVWLNRKAIDWTVARMFCLGAVPMAVLGSLFFVSVDTGLLVRLLGGSMLVVVGFTLLPRSKGIKMRLWGFPPLGATAGFLSAFLGIPGPFAALFFLAYGMGPATYIGTSSFGLGLIQALKLTVFGTNDLLTIKVISLGLVLGAIAFVASYFGHMVLRHVPTRTFPVIINVMLAAFGVLFLVQG